MRCERGRKAKYFWAALQMQFITAEVFLPLYLSHTLFKPTVKRIKVSYTHIWKTKYFSLQMFSSSCKEACLSFITLVRLLRNKFNLFCQCHPLRDRSKMVYARITHLTISSLSIVLFIPVSKDEKWEKSVISDNVSRYLDIHWYDRG